MLVRCGCQGRERDDVGGKRRLGRGHVLIRVAKRTKACENVVLYVEPGWAAVSAWLIDAAVIALAAIVAAGGLYAARTAGDRSPPVLPRLRTHRHPLRVPRHHHHHRVTLARHQAAWLPSAQGAAGATHRHAPPKLVLSRASRCRTRSLS